MCSSDLHATSPLPLACATCALGNDEIKCHYYSQAGSKKSLKMGGVLSCRGAAASFDRDILDRGVARRDKGLPGKSGPSFAPASELLDGTFEI